MRPRFSLRVIAVSHQLPGEPTPIPSNTPASRDLTARTTSNSVLLAVLAAGTTMFFISSALKDIYGSSPALSIHHPRIPLLSPIVGTADQ
ncbi:hypothetical protein CF328_g3465 [Tilletia controversa]|nr:hypothetical protein CF328_g3465 [Tilletia controversa]